MRVLFLAGILSASLSFAAESPHGKSFQLSPVSLLLIHSEKYRNPEGMKLFIDSFYDGDMKRAMADITEVYSADVFNTMGWTGETSPLDSLYGLPEQYQTPKGLRRFAREHYNGDENTVVQAVISRWGEEALCQLKWQSRN